MKRFISVYSILIVLTLGFESDAGAQGRSDLALDALAVADHVSDELLVQFQPGVPEQAKGVAVGRVGGRFVERVVNSQWRGDGKGDLHLIKLPAGLTIAAAVLGLELDANVEFAEPNWIYQHQSTINDTFYENGQLWGMYGDASSPANQYGSQAAEAWAAGNSGLVSQGAPQVYVGIIDEGYMYDHEDLRGNAGMNPGESGAKASNGIDDDGNGYVDDVYGWDFDGNNNSVFDGTIDDHGTHVAGTIGAVGGNNIGVVGVSWGVKLLNAKFLGRRGGTTANAIKAVNYFTDLKKRHGLNIVASNNSWGGGGYSQGLFDAIEAAAAADILFVAAAGNSSSNNDVYASYPSSYNLANIIAVASITSSGTLSSFSNYGAASVDIAAPGSGIMSTVPKSSKGLIKSGYASYSGTSMATPHVTGACALYAAKSGIVPAATIKAVILNSAISTSSLAGKCVDGRRLNAGGF